MDGDSLPGGRGAGTEPRKAQAPLGRMRLTSTVALSLTFLVVFASAAIVAALDYPRAAAEMPLVVCGFGALLSLLQLIVELRASRAGGEDAIDLGKDIPIYLWVWAFVLGVVALGFVVAAPVVLFVYLFFRSRESWWLSLLLSLTVVAFLYGVFQVGMGVPLFEGLLTEQIDNALTSGTEAANTTAAGRGSQASAQAFFRGKTITYIVATSPGGGYDTYGRLVARYMSKYLPGTKIIVRNLPGAGHVIGADTIYAAKPDGLTIGTFNTGLIYMQLLRAPGRALRPHQNELDRQSRIGSARPGDEPEVGHHKRAATARSVQAADHSVRRRHGLGGISGHAAGGRRDPSQRAAHPRLWWQRGRHEHAARRDGGYDWLGVLVRAVRPAG